ATETQGEPVRLVAHLRGPLLNTTKVSTSTKPNSTVARPAETAESIRSTRDFWCAIGVVTRSILGTLCGLIVSLRLSITREDIPPGLTSIHRIRPSGDPTVGKI